MEMQGLTIFKSIFQLLSHLFSLPALLPGALIVDFINFFTVQLVG